MVINWSLNVLLKAERMRLLITDEPKYKDNNIIIAKTIGEDKYGKLTQRFRGFEKECKGIIEQPDRFIFKGK